MTSFSERRKINIRLPLLSLPNRPPCNPFASSTTPKTTIVTSNDVTDKISISDIKYMDVLGTGNGGIVHKVQHKSTLEVYAMKSINGDMSPTFIKQLRREIEILCLSNSPYIVECHKIFENPFTGQVSVLMEFMDCGTLGSLSGTVTEKQLAEFSRQILKGLRYLHSLKIVHRDIKPANLLLNSKNEVKIADFGVSKIITQSPDRRNSCIGTCAYMSPERFDPMVTVTDHEIFAGDIWSFGLTILELFIGHLPLCTSRKNLNWMMHVSSEEPPKAPEKCSDEFRGFIDCCLRKNPSERWTASQLLNHPFLQENL